MSSPGLSEFLIQYEDSLHHRGHWHNLTEAAGTRTTANLPLSPYAHYTFRVLALNAVGLSRPSAPSRMYKTEAACEYAAALLSCTQLQHTAAAVIGGLVLVPASLARFKKERCIPRLRYPIRSETSFDVLG